jgi:hypothetical protein
MKTRTAHRDRRRLLRNSRRNDRNKALSPCLRRLGFEPLEDRCLLSGVAQESALELFSLSPALFVENQGQWADESVRFLHQGDGVNVAMTDAGPAFQVFQRDGSAALTPDLSPGCGRGEDVPADHASRVLQFSASFVGANLVVPVGLEQAETVFNYCIGPQEDWRSGVPSYEVVAYQNLYDGIDLQTWGQRDHLKYEFHVAPGADYRQIQVRYAGIAGLSLGEDGSLRLDLGDGWDALTDDAPYIYQQIDGQQTEIPGRFVLIDNETYAVEVTGAYDPTRELVLDPDLAWSTYLGGSGEDRGRGLAVDGAGNALVTGYTGSSGWTSGGFDTSFNGDTDAFVAKLSPSGEHVWSTYLGESDHGWGVAADAAGNALVTGITGPSDWTSGGFDTSFNGDCDAFVAKLSPSGGHLWSTYLGGDLPDWGFGIAADAAGNALMTGLTYSPGWTSGGFDTTYHGGDDAFVAKLSPSGGHLWSSYLGGDLLDWGNGIVADAAGNALVTGGTSSSGWTSGGFDTTFNGDFDAFVAKVSPSGGYLWSSYLGGNDTDEGCGIAVDAAGNVLVTGDTWSRGWTSGGFDTSYNGGADDAFAAKLSASGGQLWSTYLGGGDSDVAYGIGVDGAGNALVTGLTGSSGWTSGGFDTDFNGSADAFVAKLSPSGGHLWSTYLGGDSGDSGNGIAVDAAGNALVTGDTYSSDWVSGGFDTSYNGGEDAFVAKISGAGTPADANDTLAAATNLGTLDSGVSISQAGQIGDGASGSRDVDLLRFTLAQAGTLTLDVDAESAGSSLDAYLRLFDASGAQIAASDDVDGLDPYVSVSFPAGTYYVGVSGIPNRSYDPARLEGRVDSSTTGPYTLVITASGGEPGTWSPQIALGVPEGYDGNPDPGIFGRYLTGGVVPTVDVPFTVEVTPSPGYTTQAVALDLNFDGQRDPDEIVYAGDWTWTLDVSHSAYLQASGLHTLSVWAEGTTGGWSASATFQIETLALPGWMDPELTRIEFNPSAERYEIDSLIGERFGVNTPDWFPDWLEYRDGQKTFNGVYFGVSVEAYAKLSGKVVTESVAPVIGMSVLGIDFPLKLKANGVGFTCDLLRFWDLCKDPQGYFQGNNDPRASGFYDQRVAVPEVTFSVESQAALDDELQFTMFQVSANVQAQASGKFFELSLPEVPFPIPGAPGVSIVLTPHFGWSPYFDVDFTMNLDPSLRPHFQTSSVGLGVEGEAGVTGEVSIVGGIARGGADVTGSIAVGFQATYDGDWTRSIPVTLGMDIDFVGSVLWGLLKGRIPVWEWQWTGNLWTSGSGLGGGALDAEGSGQGASDDTLLVDASMAGSTTGEIAYAWTTINMDGTASPLSVQRYDGTSWQPAEQVIGSDYHRGNPAIISLGSDRWMAMWSQSNLAADRLAGLSGDQIVAEQEIWYAVREASGWGPPQRLTNNAVCDDSPALAALADGNVVAVWRRMAGTSTCDIAESDLVCAVWDGTAWSPPVTLADTDQRLSQPALATLLDNRVVATWLSDATASGQGGDPLVSSLRGHELVCRATSKRFDAKGA